MKVPCNGCDDRTPECHGICGKYADYAHWRSEQREKRMKEKESMFTSTHGMMKAEREFRQREKQGRARR